MGSAASFRRDVFDLVGGFRSGIGRSAERLSLGCEETELCIRLSQRAPGSVLFFDNRAVARHFVPADRCRYFYFLSRCLAEGLSKATVTVIVGAGDGLSAERHYTTRVLPRGVANGVAALLRGDPSGLGRAGAIITGLTATAAGYTVGSLRERVRRRKRGISGALTSAPGERLRGAEAVAQEGGLPGTQQATGVPTVPIPPVTRPHVWLPRQQDGLTFITRGRARGRAQTRRSTGSMLRPVQTQLRVSPGAWIRLKATWRSHTSRSTSRPTRA